MSKTDSALPDVNAYIFWATVDYHRLWLTVDQIEMWRLGEAKHKLTAQSIRRIGAAYYVNRGIRLSDGDKGAQLLAERLNGAAWPDDLVDRCRRCIEIAEWAATTNVDGNTITKGRQVSAVTKLMWFLHPTGWTLFDRLVANALRVPAYLARPDRARRYYESLAARGFTKCAERANACVATASFPGFRAERVLDRYLMIRGGLYGEQVSELPLVLEGYLRGLGSDASGALIDLAHRLQGTLGPDPMYAYERAA